MFDCRAVHAKPIRTEQARIGRTIQVIYVALPSFPARRHTPQGLNRSPRRSRDTRPLSDATKHSQTTHRKNGRHVARGGRPVAEDVCINLVGPTDRDKVACARFDGGARSPARRRARVSANYLGQHKKSVWVWVCDAHRGTRCS